MSMPKAAYKYIYNLVKIVSPLMIPHGYLFLLSSKQYVGTDFTNFKSDDHIAFPLATIGTDLQFSKILILG